MSAAEINVDPAEWSLAVELQEKRLRVQEQQAVMRRQAYMVRRADACIMDVEEYLRRDDYAGAFERIAQHRHQIAQYKHKQKESKHVQGSTPTMAR